MKLDERGNANMSSPTKSNGIKRSETDSNKSDKPNGEHGSHNASGLVRQPTTKPPAFEPQIGYRQWVAQAGTLIADLLTCAGADHVITMDLHGT